METGAVSAARVDQRQISEDPKIRGIVGDELGDAMLQQGRGEQR